MIAHDLQQPVNAIMLRVQLLIRRVLEEKGRTFVLQSARRRSSCLA